MSDAETALPTSTANGGPQMQTDHEAQEVQQLIAQLQDADPAVRQRAAAALGERGVKARQAAPALVTCLRDEHAPVRRMAALSLGDIAARADVAVPALTVALH